MYSDLVLQPVCVRRQSRRRRDERACGTKQNPWEADRSATPSPNLPTRRCCRKQCSNPKCIYGQPTARAESALPARQGWRSPVPRRLFFTICFARSGKSQRLHSLLLGIKRPPGDTIKRQLGREYANCGKAQACALGGTLVGPLPYPMEASMAAVCMVRNDVRTCLSSAHMHDPCRLQPGCRRPRQCARSARSRTAWRTGHDRPFASFPVPCCTDGANYPTDKKLGRVPMNLIPLRRRREAPRGHGPSCLGTQGLSARAPSASSPSCRQSCARGWLLRRVRFG